MADEQVPSRQEPVNITPSPAQVPPAPVGGNGVHRADGPDHSRAPGGLTHGALVPWLVGLGKSLALALGLMLLFLVALLVGGVSLGTALGLSAVAGVVLSAVIRIYFFPAASQKRTASAAEPHPTDSTREVVETVVFVVVLVLLLKSFAAEAFVIPTGSMAETLYGYQKMVTCPQCGVEFPVNASDEVEPSRGEPTPIYACTCPNCRQLIRFPGAPPDWVEANRIASIEIPDPRPTSGDRVLVAKFTFSLTERDPDRLDVVVFKFPGNNGRHAEDPFPQSGPQKNHTPMNYIKRLIGKPGETIAIHRGKIYILPPEAGLRYDDWEKADPEQRKQLWQHDYMHVNDQRARDLWDEGKFQILRKDPRTILAMMRLVYDNNHPAKDKKDFPRWAGEENSGWAGAPDHGFRHPADSDAQVKWLHYHHLLRTYDDKPSLITDFMGYNSGLSGRKSSLPGENWASDLILECEVTPEKAQGEFSLELSKGVDRFRATWDLAARTCTLHRVTTGGRTQPLDSKPSTLKPGSSYRLRFANVDQKLTVWVDNNLVFGEEGVVYDPPPPGQRGPQKENDLDRPAGVGVKGAGVSVRNLKLYRDTYYTAAVTGSPSSSDARFDPADPEKWGDLGDRMPVGTMYVQPEHFLCLGDNSPESSDGRSWGTVPRRLLLGRAVLVYWPFGRSGRIR